MAIYIAVPLEETTASLNEAVIDKIEEKYRYPLQNDRGWLIKFEGTSVELSNHLGITEKGSAAQSKVGSAIVAPITTYWGRGSTDMWEWIKTRNEMDAR